jgi:aspartate/tyrosine/aromatic aminotransferase
MFQTLAAPPMDPILAIMQAFRDDPREGKVDLGVGVYKDDLGNTPVMRAVKAAELRLVQTQDSKSYVALAGDPAFHAAMADLVFAGVVPGDRLAAAASTGGTGAVKLAMDLIKRANPDARVWISAQTWPNHTLLAQMAGLDWRPYRYLDAESGAVDFGAMMTDLAGARAGDVVLLHGCCHNPTGADLNLTQWAELAKDIGARGLIPFVDLAYQGFGEGLDGDAAGLRHLAARSERMIVAASAAKNFGLYRERAGICMVICAPTERAAVQGTLASLNRASVSFPPDHGARVVTTILQDAALRADWQDELEGMRQRVEGLRRALAEGLRKRTHSDRFGFIAAQRGMFSTLGCSDEALRRLREEHGIYLVGGGRMNVAGLSAGNVDAVADALAAVLAP